MREFLVTKFVCAKCFVNLQLAEETPKGAGRYAHGEPTGALMVQNVIAIEPCQCSREPLDEMRRAVSVLMGNRP